VHLDTGDWVWIVIGALMIICAIIFAVAAVVKTGIKGGDKILLWFLAVVLLAFGVATPAKTISDTRDTQAAYAAVQKAHPDFRVQSLDLSADTITYIRAGKGSDPFLCSASLLELNGRILVATVGAQCAPYNTAP